VRITTIGLLSLTLSIGVEKTFCQNVEIETPGASTPFLFDTYSSDPSFHAGLDWYGVLGTESKQLWKIYSGYVYTGTVFETSDENLKENITDLGFVSDKLKEIKTVRYDLKLKIEAPKNSDKYKKMDTERKNHIGFLAQDLKETFPELVQESPETGRMYVNYSGMVPILLKAIVELQDRVDQLEKKTKNQ